MCCWIPRKALFGSKQFPLFSLAYWGELWKPLAIVNPQKDMQYGSQEVFSPSDPWPQRMRPHQRLTLFKPAFFCISGCHGSTGGKAGEECGPQTGRVEERHDQKKTPDSRTSEWQERASVGAAGPPFFFLLFFFKIEKRTNIKEIIPPLGSFNYSGLPVFSQLCESVEGHPEPIGWCRWSLSWLDRQAVFYFVSVLACCFLFTMNRVTAVFPCHSHSYFPARFTSSFKSS